MAALTLAFWISVWTPALVSCFLLNLQKPKTAYIFLTATALLAVPLLFCAEKAVSAYTLMLFLLLLLYIWPLRFIGLGEITLSLLFGVFFWHGIGHITGFNRLYTALGIGFSLILFIGVFWMKIRHYASDKAVQQYSLPVILGRIFPAIDRRWSRK